jgi:hypothetical protein
MKTAMQEDKETAIEWLIRMLYSPACVGFISGRRVIPHEIIEQAKEMEKRQMEELALYIYEYSVTCLEERINPDGKKKFEQYYNQTYNQKIPELLYKDGTPMRKVKLGKEAQELLDEATKRFNQNK